MPDVKMISVTVAPGRSLVEVPAASIKRLKVAMGRNSFEERTAAVDMVRRGPGHTMELPEDEAKHLIERGFVRPA